MASTNQTFEKSCPDLQLYISFMIITCEKGRALRANCIKRYENEEREELNCTELWVSRHPPYSQQNQEIYTDLSQVTNLRNSNLCPEELRGPLLVSHSNEQTWSVTSMFKHTHSLIQEKRQVWETSD